jgi:hypothetical protein
LKICIPSSKFPYKSAYTTSLFVILGIYDTMIAVGHEVKKKVLKLANIFGLGRNVQFWNIFSPQGTSGFSESPSTVFAGMNLE